MQNSPDVRKCVCAIVILSFLLVLLTPQAYALSPYRPRFQMRSTPYTDSDVNIITNVVNGEVGGISGLVKMTYADGTVASADACTIHQIHAMVVSNQVQSNIFPDTVRSCVSMYWSENYTGTWRQDSEQWEHCHTDVLAALYGFIDVPQNVYAATCDPYFANMYEGYSLWARVDWDTGWCNGSFYYYSYGGDE